ncbi:MAG: hypothetical protein NC453_28465, partial [Muribaculum sp.]|nr:hypothetical protein [Muribaculum sp.]
KTAVNRVFSKQESPEQNKIIASLLREVGSQLYSEKSRMLFELLQNADDAAPSRNQDKESNAPHVQVAIEITKDGILFRHNGCAFNFEDFYSITSAANSTKGVKKRSTGYKGIGFKSVFTNSKSVFIISQGFSFSFNRSNPIFDVSRFDDLYRKVRNFSSAQEERNFFVKYAEQRSQYRGIDDLPWQIMPFWTDERNIHDLSFSIKSDNVVIGLNMDSLSRDEYQTAIEEVFNNPRMFLFLRNTRRLQFSGLDDLSPITIQKDFDPLNNIIRLTSSYNQSEDEIYKIINFSDIEISDKAFEKAGVDIKIKCEEKNGIEEYSFVEVYNGIEGKKVNNIPEKIASANFSSITIAFNVDENGQIVPLKTNSLQSSLYAYLPMNEQRFRFPFFVNADFVLSSSREGLQADNKWNVFLFHKIGELVVSALSSIANTNNPKYLKLFPRLFDSSRVATSEIAKTFNKSYSESLQSESFILDENGILRPQDEIIYDNTGLSAIIGNEVFRQLLNTSKYLPSTEIDRTPLLSSPFDSVEIVEPICLNDILSQGDVSCINSWLNSVTAEESRVDFFKWIIENDEFDLESIIKRLSFISVNKSFTTLESLEDGDNKFILSSNTFGIADILNKLGATCADDDLTDHLLANFINITDDTVIYDFVKEQDLSSLSYKDRLRLFRSMENWEGVGEAKRKDIRIFKSLNDDLISFNDVLLSRSIMPDWYRNFVISNKELCVGISKYLPESPKESFDKAFNKMLNDGIVTVLEFYNLFKEDKLWSSANTVAVINHFGFDVTILDIVEKSDDISKQLFIDKVPKIELQSNTHYTPDSYEYRILELALSCGKGLDLRRKICVDSIGLSEYAVSNHVSYSYNNTTYQLSLSEILPNHSSENALGMVMSNFVSIPSINILFSQQEKDKQVLRREFIEYIKVGKPYLNWAEVAYIALEHLTNSKWTNYERSFMVLPEDNDELLKIFNQLIEKRWSALMKTFIDLNNIYFTHIKGKYFDSDSYTLHEEQLPSYLKSWLYSGNMKEQRSDLLILLGAYSSTSNEIKRRRRFLGETSVDADWSITGIALKSFCNWLIKTQVLTNLTPTQKEIIKNLAEKTPSIITKDFDLPQLENAHEYDDDCYKVWRETSTISIYLIDGDIPRVYKFNDTVLLKFEEGAVDYVSEKKIIYVNANNDLE